MACVLCCPSPPFPSPAGVASLHSPPPPKAMATGSESLLSGALAALSARLDALRTDQNPEDLSSALRDAFKQRELYNLYVFSSVGDRERAKALLEVFDRVWPCEMCYSVNWFSAWIYGTGPSGHHLRCHNLQTVSPTVRSGGASTYVSHHSREPCQNHRESHCLWRVWRCLGRYLQRQPSGDKGSARVQG